MAGGEGVEGAVRREGESEFILRVYLSGAGRAEIVSGRSTMGSCEETSPDSKKLEVERRETFSFSPADDTAPCNASPCIPTYFCTVT